MSLVSLMPLQNPKFQQNMSLDRDQLSNIQ